MNAEISLTNLWGEIADATLESEFRQRELASEIARAKILFSLTSVIVLILGLNDYFLFQLRPPFWNLVATRVAVGVISIATLHGILRHRTPIHMDRMMLSWGVLYMLLVLYVDSTRPEQFANGSILDVIVLLTIYLAVNSRLKLQVIPAVLYTVGNFSMLGYKTNLTNIIIVSTAAIILSANFIGFAVAWFLNRAARMQFLGLKAEEALRKQLEAAMAKIKTLEGLLPICSYCRMMRDGDGTWKVVEQYIAEHTDAIFTHGICPDCSEKHFPDQKRTRTNK